MSNSDNESIGTGHLGPVPTDRLSQIRESLMESFSEFTTSQKLEQNSGQSEKTTNRRKPLAEVCGQSVEGNRPKIPPKGLGGKQSKVTNYDK